MEVFPHLSAEPKTTSACSVLWPKDFGASFHLLRLRALLEQLRCVFLCARPALRVFLSSSAARFCAYGQLSGVARPTGETHSGNGRLVYKVRSGENGDAVQIYDGDN